MKLPVHGHRLAAGKAHGQWLREQRQARGWSVALMRRKLREAAKSAGDTLPGNECLTVMIHRWENGRSGISERYRLHGCEAFQIPADSFGDLAAGPMTGHPAACALPAGIARPATGEQPHASAAAGPCPADRADQRRLWFLMGYVSCLLASAAKENNAAR